MKLQKQNLGKVSITVEKEYWNANKVYDRLTIVEVVGVGCYLSRRAVPAGIEYDNRDYWIKFSSLSDAGSPVNIVTEFGDSVDLAIAQKTLTSRFINLENTLDNVTEDYGNALEELNNKVVIDAGDGHNITFQSFYDNWYLRFVDETQYGVNAAQRGVVELRSEVDSRISNILNKTNGYSILRSKLQDTERLFYIGGRITTTNFDRTLTNRLKAVLGFSDEDTNCTFEVAEDLNRTRLPQALYGESLRSNNFANTKAIVIQFDTTFRHIGDISDIPVYGTENPAENMYGSVTTEIDKIHRGNPNCQVFLVAPPYKIKYTPTGEDQHLEDNTKEKIIALENIANATGATFINPNKYGFSYRYLAMFEDITLTDEERAVLQSDFVLKWANYVAHEINYNFI